jgi:hypothetical protein
MEDVFDELREEIGELRKMIYAARDRGMGEDDPELRGYIRTLHAREELLERLEQPGRDAPSPLVIRLFGIPVAEDDARNLVTTLLDDGSPYAVAAARTIHHGVNAGAELVALTAGQRDAILAALEDPPSPGLGELRAALVWDALERRDGGPSA